VITSDQALVIQSGSLHKGVLLNLLCSQFFHLKILTLEIFASSKKKEMIEALEKLLELNRLTKQGMIIT